MAHLVKTLASDPDIRRWHLVLDNLYLHQSESLVRLVAARDRILPTWKR